MSCAVSKRHSDVRGKTEPEITEFDFKIGMPTTVAGGAPHAATTEDTYLGYRIPAGVPVVNNVNIQSFLGVPDIALTSALGLEHQQQSHKPS